jgi:hypothetical protein
MMATLSGDERTGEGYSVRLLATARAGLRSEAAAFLLHSRTKNTSARSVVQDNGAQS